MAKKQKIEEVEVPVVETPVVETPKPKKVEPKKPTWEIKDRIYYLKKNKPLSYRLKSCNVYWFDKDKNIEVLLGSNLIKGTAIDIKKNGSLILKTKNETKEVASGEIISF